MEAGGAAEPSHAAPGSFCTFSALDLHFCFFYLFFLFFRLMCRPLFCPSWHLSHKHVCLTTAQFLCTHFPVPLVKDFLSLVLFIPTVSLSLTPSLTALLFPIPPTPKPHSPNPPTPGCHCVHMAPACDMKPSQNTPDALFSPPLFQALLNFKQNKGKGKERGEEGGRGGLERVGYGGVGVWWGRSARGMCNSITISFIHSPTLCPVHHRQRTPL